MTTFYSFYFPDDAHSALPRPPTDDIGSIRAMAECLPIFSHPGNHIGKFNSYRRIDPVEMHIAHTYALLNCPEVVPYVEQFEGIARAKYSRISEHVLSRYRDREFANWFNKNVRNLLLYTFVKILLDI